MSQSRILRDNRRSGRERLADRLDLLTDLSPRKGGHAAKWAYPDSDREGHAEASSGPDGGVGLPDRLPAQAVPARIGPIPAAPVPAGPLPAESAQAVGLDAGQKEDVIKYLGLGMGRYGACAQVGVLVRRLCEEMHRDTTFGDRVRDTEKRCVDDCLMTIYETALGGSLPAAVAYVKFARDEEATEEALRQGRERLKNEGKVADAYAGKASINMGNLDNAEFVRFRDLHTRLAAGATLAPEESNDYVILMQKMSGAPVRPGAAPPPGLPAPLAPGDIQDVERLFGVDNNEAG